MIIFDTHTLHSKTEEHWMEKSLSLILKDSNIQLLNWGIRWQNSQSSQGFLWLLLFIVCMFSCSVVSDSLWPKGL